MKTNEGKSEYLIPSLQQLKKKVERVFGVQPSVVLSEVRVGVSEDTCGDECGKRQFRAFGEVFLKQNGVDVCVKREGSEDVRTCEEDMEDKEDEKDEKDKKDKEDKEDKKNKEDKEEREHTNFPLHTLPYRYLLHPPLHTSSLSLTSPPPLSNRLSFWRDLLPTPSHTPFNRYLYRKIPPCLHPTTPTPSSPTLSPEEVSVMSSTLTPSQNEALMVCFLHSSNCSRLFDSSASNCYAIQPRGRSPIPRRMQSLQYSMPSLLRTALSLLSLTETCTTTTKRPSSTVSL